MENGQQRPYSKDEIEKKMKKLIKDITYTLCLQETEPTVILMHSRWDLIRVTRSLAEKKEELLAELGLKPIAIDTNQDLSDSSCCICGKTKDEFNVSTDDEDDDDSNESDDEEDDDDKGEGDDDEGKGEGDGDGDGDIVDDDEDDDDHHFISTPFCFHKVCKTCWREYLEKNFYSLKKNLTTISCPIENCGAAVGQKTIEKLGKRDQEKYESYLLRSYLEINQFSTSNCSLAMNIFEFIYSSVMKCIGLCS